MKIRKAFCYPAVYSGADQDFARCGAGGEPRCRVYRVTESSKIYYALGADVTNVRHSRIHRTAESQPRARLCSVTHRFQQRRRRLNRPSMVFGPTDSRYEQGHHFVTDQFVDDGVVTDEDLGRGAVKSI